MGFLLPRFMGKHGVARAFSKNHLPELGSNYDNKPSATAFSG